MKIFKKHYLNNTIDALKFKAWTDIQAKVIPSATKGKDIIGVSETGSGKTHAFLLPIFDQIDASKHEVQALILAPTRELAKQIESMARFIVKQADETIHIRTYSGGEDRLKEINRLKTSKPHIVIGTPGKVYDLAIKERVLPLHKVKHLVIDEADMSLDSGFLNDLEAVINTVHKDAQFMVFSATMVKSLRDMLKKVMHNPLEVVLEQQNLSQLPITHYFIKVNPDKILNTLESLLKTMNPYLGLIFANTKEEAKHTAQHLRQAGYKVTALHGDMSSRERKQALRDIDSLHVQYIIASDMASRGMDIKGISHIINLGFPKDMSFYIHRSGRTGRMGQSGQVYTFYTDRSHQSFKALLKENVTLNFADVKRGELVKKQTDDAILKKASTPARVKKTIKETVKPGYKKKYHQKQKHKKKGSSS